MDDFGFIRAAAAVPEVRVADVDANVAEICRMIDDACSSQVSLVVFPELCVTGYTCGDLFGQEILVRKAEEGVRKIASHCSGRKITVVVGVPLRWNSRLYNCAAVISGEKVCGIVPKTYLPSYNEFYETRWFSSGSLFIHSPEEISYAGFSCKMTPEQIFHIGGHSFCIEICEDLWAPVPPSSYHCLNGAEIVVNLSASNEVLGKHVYRKQLVSQQSARTISGYVYCSAGYGESTQDLVFAGSALIYENGALLAKGERFRMGRSMTVADIDCGKIEILRQKTSTFGSVMPDGKDAASIGYLHVRAGEPADTDFDADLFRTVYPHPFVPGGEETDKRCREIISMQVLALASRLAHINCRTAVIGISGGLDSSLALIVTVLAADRLGWDRSRIIGVTMPGYGTTGRTRSNAEDLMDVLGVTSRRISIKAACDRHFEDIGHDSSIHDTTYENSQARERTQILMDVANQTGGIVIGTGDLSELALGWATYNGDHMSMYGVNASIPKTLVRHLVRWAAENHFDSGSCSDGCHAGTHGRSAKDILMDIIDTPISPELLPADEKGNISQVTEDLVGPYELHDFFLYHFFRFGYSPQKLFFLAKKAFGSTASDGTFYDEQTIRKWLNVFLKRFFAQQFKRSCLPDGPKVGSVSLSPRGDWRMPSDAKPDLFLKDI
ncbi:MAG: NAD(+) synthase [Bacteroidetes bacterium]|uniref:Glutamine-dependent NAD(+) synthetase n=1 Tax=Candidatus Cryptobacteroides faecigallinarum TaxID=2840763 RepID=A0A9D9IJ66_9BACT|nr:NAD(+) synthase [Candidatus Cryptobacteroides faecigallinarum]